MKRKFLEGGGETGNLARSKDWSGSPIGDPKDWPESLRAAFSIILHSNFPMFIWWGPELVMLYNDAYIEISGGKHPASFGGLGPVVWSEIWDEVGPLVNDVVEKGISTWSQDHLFLINRNGVNEETYFTFCQSPVHNESGLIGGVFGVCFETTSLVYNARQIIQSEKTLRNLILQAPIGMGIIRKTDMFAEVVNKTFLQVVGKQQKEFDEKPFWEVLKEAAEFYAPILKDVFETGIAYTGHEHEIVLNRNGKEETIWVNFVYEPIREQDGSIERVMNVVIEITETVKARLEVEKVNEQLKRSNAELKQFAYIASHDLQEPLRKVTNYTLMLEDSLGTIDKHSSNYLTKINTSTSRMQNLIRDILAYSEVSVDIDAFEPVDLGSVIEQILIDFELLIEQKAANVEFAGLPVIKAIPLQMNQLFSNLISNSLKYTLVQKRPEIKISTGIITKKEIDTYHIALADLNYTKIVVCDNGIGFNQDNAEDIFDIFRRLHKKVEFSGTGIGLAMCRKVTENHQGHIYATSNENGGAVFNIILPTNPKGITV